VNPGFYGFLVQRPHDLPGVCIARVWRTVYGQLLVEFFTPDGRRMGKERGRKPKAYILVSVAQTFGTFQPISFGLSSPHL